MLDVQHAVDGRERPEEQRDRRAHPRARVGERVDRAEAEDERERRGEHVLAEADARLAVEERVVERVDEGDAGGGAEDERLARATAHLRRRPLALRRPFGDDRHRSAPSKNPITRRSYSSGRAVQSAGVLGLGDLPQRLGLARGAVVAAVEVLSVRAVGSGDQEQRGGSDARYQLLEVGRRHLVVEHRDRSRLDRGQREAGHLLGRRHVLVQVLRHRSRAGALGHDGAELVGCGGGLEHQLATDGEAEAADAAFLDVGPALQERDRRLDVLAAAPAPGVGVAFALAFAATVEQQDAVTVAGQHPRLRSAGRCGPGTRSPRHRCATARTSPRARARRWS